MTWRLAGNDFSALLHAVPASYRIWSLRFKPVFVLQPSPLSKFSWSTESTARPSPQLHRETSSTWSLKHNGATGWTTNFRNFIAKISNLALSSTCRTISAETVRDMIASSQNKTQINMCSQSQECAHFIARRARTLSQDFLTSRIIPNAAFAGVFLYDYQMDVPFLTLRLK